MLRAAAVLGARHGLEQVQMSDVAARADVAVATVYRYFPSKHHLFAALMADQVGRLPVRSDPDATPDQAVAEVLVAAVRAMLRNLPLARAMIVSTNVVRAEHPTVRAVPLDEHVLAVAALRTPREEDRRLARLVEQCVYGILTWATAGELAVDQAVQDVHRACGLLLAPWRGRARSTT